MKPTLIASMAKSAVVTPKAETPVQKPIKEAAEDSYASVVCDLLLYNTTVRVAHWKASTSTNEHKALGDLYELVDGALDNFMEVAMGNMGKREFSSTKGELDASASVDSILSKLRESAKKLISLSKKNDDEDLLNIAADLLIGINKQAYLLQK